METARRAVRDLVTWVEASLGEREVPFRPRSRAGLAATLAMQVLAVALLVRVSASTFRPFFAVQRPPPLPTVEPPGVRFGLPEAVRKEIFAEMAAAEIADRAHDEKANTWKGHKWSQEDDRGYRERVLARSIAFRHRVTLTQVYLAFEEGIHERWAGPDGRPLPASVPPLDLRHE